MVENSPELSQDAAHPISIIDDATGVTHDNKYHRLRQYAAKRLQDKASQEAAKKADQIRMILRPQNHQQSSPVITTPPVLPTEVPQNFFRRVMMQLNNWFK